MKKSKKKLDQIDILIIDELQKNPRQSLREIKKILTKQGHDVSIETIRKRMLKIEKYLSFHPIPNLQELGYYRALLLIRIKGTRQERQRVQKKIHQMDCCFCTADTSGAYEVITFVAFENVSELAEVIEKIKEIPQVQDVVSLLITRMHTPITGLLKRLNKI